MSNSIGDDMSKLELWLSITVVFFIIWYLLSFTVAYFIYLKKIKKKHLSAIQQKINSINTLYQKIEKLSARNVYLERRVIEVEDGIESGFGAKIRQEVTVVNAEFTKLEMVIMLAGVSVLLKNPKTVDDAEFYINLSKKIQKLIDNMKEEMGE